MAENIVFGYARVSTTDQNADRQVEQLLAQGINERHIFVDKQSGKDFNREQYKAMVAMLREGDVVYVKSIDRLGRNYSEIAEQWGIITREKGADIVILDMPLLDTRRDKDRTLLDHVIRDITFTLLSYVAQTERDYIKQRQAEGIAIAKAKGVYKGRKPISVDKAAFEKAFAKVEKGEWTNRYAMSQLGLKPNTYYRFVSEFKEKKGMWAE